MEAVDHPLRFESPRTRDVAAMMVRGSRLHVLTDGTGRGFAVTRGTRLQLLGADDVGAGRTTLSRALGALADAQHEATPEHGTPAGVEVYGLTSAQSWAIAPLLDVRLAISALGAMFLSGPDPYPVPYVPSGLIF